MKVEKIDHIHVYVKDLDQAISAFTEVFGSEFGISGDNTVIWDGSADFGVRTAYHPLGVDLLQVTDPAKNRNRMKLLREGVISISLKVANIDEATAELEAKGLKLLFRVQVGEVKESLFQSPKTPGLQIELAEYPGNDILAAAHASKDRWKVNK